MSQHTSSNYDERRRQLLQTVAVSLFQYFEIEVELRNLEEPRHRETTLPDAASVVSLLSRFLAGLTAAIDKAPQAGTTLPVPVSPQSPTEPVTMISCFDNSRRERTTLCGVVIDLNVERRVRYHDREKSPGTLWLSWTEWEVAVALVEAGASGLTAGELASKVTRWHGTRPSNEAVQRIVSKVTVKFEDAGIPFRGRTENVNPSIAPESKKRRRGRPPKPGDGRFRAFLHEASP